MMKRLGWMAGLAAVVLVAAASAKDDGASEGTAPSEDAAKAKPAVKLDGKDLYKTYCKACHGPDAAAGEYTPMTLIGEQWERFFDEKLTDTHAETADPTNADAKLLDVLTPEMRQAMRKFCVDHAADSEHPMTCG